MSYAAEFVRISVAHLLAVAAPGPDFAIVLRQSLTQGRRAGIMTALGIATGLTMHVTYSLFGVGILIARAPTVFIAIKWAGAAYLAWLGIQSIRASARPIPAAESTPAPAAGGRGDAACYRAGLFTNALNPKVTLFFVAIFATLVSPLTPTHIRILYGAWVCLVTAVWFIAVATLFTHEPVRRGFLRLGPWIDRTLGVVFIGFAALLAAASLK